ncbi:4-carboxy-4-hydroxy-2-oxoadipate aldolase/oxaloacetate decarboxylase [Alkalihalobacillus sp. MEB130]|uniref:4-carboxy-4-hydroxy-2-oxoadipate aldolase/oxaloacetate decarboxylase n=1 Tax=Alkalihalobacillus sp. MEB130 TaxID=2976704 RepID=UPI0028DEAA45|nr:4-carboxy-4-hydroxy-2-oxoadipate aldolase/oxaloacetate decarboxylase [Alkalihalobacillus sp. MEB130]MDT8861838.1 4-carboxy-4-hydroxy-2-oxoadipate aldolase/oxaloacetate decarboxylase [Alkalihalobacillus sp. MEB130]
MEKFVIKNIKRPEKNIVEEYKRLDVSTVYEAQGKKGLINHEIQPVQNNSFICGPAVTAVCYAGDNLMIHAAIEVCQPGDILVVTTIGESTSGMIGELIVMALQKRGVKGLIIDSGIRDVARIRELGFPVWSKAISSEGTTKNRGGAVNAAAICGGCLIEPGDLILADDDGVVNVKKKDLETTLELSKKRMQKEEMTKEKINNGELSLDFYGLREMLEKENVVYYDSYQEQVK